MVVGYHGTIGGKSFDLDRFEPALQAGQSIDRSTATIPPDVVVVHFSIQQLLSYQKSKAI